MMRSISSRLQLHVGVVVNGSILHLRGLVLTLLDWLSIHLSSDCSVGIDTNVLELNQSSSLANAVA
jgi:hypothetical protein